MALGYESQVQLLAGQWTDDESDLPLRYAFRRVRLLLPASDDAELSGGGGEFCRTGLLNPNENVCCDASCGTCGGGNGCGIRNGGKAGCCKQAIMASGVDCTTPTQTRCKIPQPPPSASNKCTHYVNIWPGSTDTWCKDNCFHNPPYCPPSHCQCDAWEAAPMPPPAAPSPPPPSLVEEGGEVPLGGLSTSRYGYWHLPVRGVWRLKVHVYDVWGAVATAAAQVEVVGAAQGQLLQPGMGGNLTREIEEVGVAGDLDTMTQMIHSVSQTLNEQDIDDEDETALEAAQELRASLLLLMCGQSACESNDAEGNFACAAALASVLTDSVAMTKDMLSVGLCVLRQMIASQVASGLIDFSSTDGTRETPRQSNAAISSLLGAADGLATRSDSAQDKAYMQDIVVRHSFS